MPHIRLLLSALLSLLWPVAAQAECMGPYPPSMVRAFNQNCAKDPKMLPFCNCIMDEVQRNIPLADFIETGNSPTGINGDPRFIKASQKCAPQLSGAPPVANPPVSSMPAVPGGSGAAGVNGPSR